MSRTILLVWVMAGLLAGCAGTPQESGRLTETGSGSGFYASGKAHVTGPASQLAQRWRTLRQASLKAMRQALLDEHERWEGTPYELGGEGLRGIDCSALVQQVYREAFALELPRTTSDQIHEGKIVKRDALEAGDLVFFRPPGVYRHVGIYVDDGYFLHASTSQGVKLSRLDNVFWNRYYWQARRPMPLKVIAQRLE